MKKFYMIVIVAISIMVLSWFLPWLYSLILPSAGTDPFISYSPVSDSFIVTEYHGDESTTIHELLPDNTLGPELTTEDRDSLLPQIFYTQLIGHERLPDSINGVKVGIPEFRHNGWNFSSLPRDLNRTDAEVYLIMESMPERFDLEDPKEVFRFKDGDFELIDIKTNSVLEKRSRRFDEIFKDRGFKLPIKSASANISTLKSYDDGYLLADDNGDAYHFKMQAGRPYMVKIPTPDSVKVKHVFILEKTEKRHLGLMTDENDNFYVIERENYRVYPLAVGKVNPERDRISVVKNLFNWVVRISNPDGVRWVALDSEDYSPKGSYSRTKELTAAQKVSGYIFPFDISFTDTSDCYAYPRISNISAKALIPNVILAVIILVVYRRRRCTTELTVCATAVTVVFGIFSFIPFLMIKD
ncbi:MAG: DUF4857 domain-containing protein [Bacteroides sp.]|nr:DUF4857 domain-containing protein [Bacteroides sp.]